MTKLTLIPYNVVSLDHDLYYGNQWVHLSEEGILYAYGIMGDKTTVVKTFEYPTTVPHTTEPHNGTVAYKFSVDTPEYGEIELVVLKAGGCACADPRKQVTDPERMEIVAIRSEAKAARQVQTDAAVAQRRAVAKQRAVEDRRDRFQKAQENRRIQSQK